MISPVTYRVDHTQAPHALSSPYLNPIKKPGLLIEERGGGREADFFTPSPGETER